MGNYKYDPIDFDGELRNYVAAFYRAYEEHDESLMADNLGKIRTVIGDYPPPRHVNLMAYLFTLYFPETEKIGIITRIRRAVRRNMLGIEYRLRYVSYLLTKYAEPESEDNHTSGGGFRFAAATFMILLIGMIQAGFFIFCIWCILSLVSYLGAGFTDVQIAIASILLGLLISIVRLGITKNDIKKMAILFILGYLCVVLHTWYRTGNLIFIP